jgi:putative transposase
MSPRPASGGTACIHDDLREAGVPVSRKRLARLMRQVGLRARQRKRVRVTTMSEPVQPIVPNHLARRFVAEALNQRWVSDTTDFPIGTSGKRVWPRSLICTRGSSSAGP